jgi:hypothetical protein
VTLSLTLKRTKTGEILWQNRNLSYFDTYFEATNALATQELRNEALGEIAVFLAEGIHQSIFDEF